MTEERYRGNIYRNEPAPLGATPCHQAIACVRRLAPAGFPVHVGIHHVATGATPNCQAYSEPHRHPDQDEVNILISDTSLTYRLTMDDESYEVAAPATIWIPAGVRHSANVIAGSGVFVCLRLDRQAAAPPDRQ